MQAHLIHSSVTHNRVRIDYIVDFQEKTISIVDSNRNNKEFVFVGRGPEYVQGWLNILDAIKIAIEEGERLLKEQSDKDLMDVIDLVMDLDK